MTAADGLLVWQDGPVNPAAASEMDDTATPTITQAMIDGRYLWAVTELQVPHAPERCHFGEGLPSGIVKHSNLTGGRSAYCGGEVLKISDKEIIINGWSGRYGPKSEAEMRAVAAAFKKSGYYVWQMGFDPEAARAYPFIGPSPQWVP
jgi:hypothetical protein